METRKQRTENETQFENREPFSAFQISFADKLVCAACGAAARRENARFCLICGKRLHDGYQPLDRLRASYNWQKKDSNFVAAKKVENTEVTNLFEQNKNSISQTAWACLVYSFVPYLGILFVPFTFLIGGFGYAAAVRHPQLGGRRLALVSFWLSFVVLAFQIFLWWLLYIIPEIGNQL